VQPLRSQEFPGHFDIGVWGWEGKDTLSVAWMFNRDLYDRWRIDQMGRHYVRFLEAMLRNIDQEISNVEMLTVDERQQVLEDWNDTDWDFGIE
jgi:non-ribosomal peptide synthetase component F